MEARQSHFVNGGVLIIKALQLIREIILYLLSTSYNVFVITCIHLSLSLILSVSLSFCLSVFLSVSYSVYLLVIISVCHFVCLSAC